MKKNDHTALITNEILLAIAQQLYSIELILADVYCGKANLRYSSAILEQDSEILKRLRKIVADNMKD